MKNVYPLVLFGFTEEKSFFFFLIVPIVDDDIRSVISR